MGSILQIVDEEAEEGQEDRFKLNVVGTNTSFGEFLSSSGLTGLYLREKAESSGYHLIVADKEGVEERVLWGVFIPEEKKFSSILLEKTLGKPGRLVEKHNHRAREMGADDILRISRKLKSRKSLINPDFIPMSVLAGSIVGIIFWINQKNFPIALLLAFLTFLLVVLVLSGRESNV